MTRFDKRVRALAACLSGLAGYVDAIGFLQLGGFFVSFMSGNSTRLAVGLAQGSIHAAIAAGLIVSFIIGVVAGSLVNRVARTNRRSAVMALVSALLFAAAALSAFGFTGIGVVAMALAMGAENAVFEQDGEVRIGLTYMTGTLVKLGQRLATAFHGGEPLAWTPYFLLWLGLVGGAVAGAAAYHLLAMGALWLAGGVAAILAWVAAKIGSGEAATETAADAPPKG